MTIHYGKRGAGALTAASPGDTLYIPLSFYNDSGASISIGSTLAVTDVELFKNGGIVERATDSGYAILGDTGNFDNRIGFKGISISLFNTADDTGFYDAGSTYWVAIDNVTVDGRTVRFWPAIFEIGLPSVNVTQIDGDTGSADVLGKATNGVGGVSFSAGIFVDTLSSTAVNQVVDGVWDEADTGHSDTGTYGRLRQGVNLGKIRGDTGAADRLLKLAGSQLKTDGTFDTGTGQTTNTFNVTATATTDTGQVNNAVWNGLRADHAAAGSFGEYVLADVQLVNADTGAAAHLAQLGDEYDTGRLPADATATVDTGAVNNAVWNGLRADHVTSGSFGEYVSADVQLVNADTGAAAHLAQMADEYDTGRLAAEATATLDTGAVVNAIWDASRSAHVTAGTFGASDTGINNRLAVILADTDTGIQSSVNVTSLSDTGVNNRLAVILADTDTGIQSGVAVTSISDTGINNRLAVILADTDTGIQSSVNVTSSSDTGINARLTALSTAVTQLDTGQGSIKDVTQQFTFDTGGGTVNVNIAYVNSTLITGTGDTGLGTTWGPA